MLWSKAIVGHKRARGPLSRRCARQGDGRPWHFPRRTTRRAHAEWPLHRIDARRTQTPGTPPTTADSKVTSSRGETLSNNAS